MVSSGYEWLNSSSELVRVVSSCFGVVSSGFVLFRVVSSCFELFRVVSSGFE